MGIHDIWLFVLAAVLLAVTPGPDTALILARTARYGARGGIAASLGIGAGSFVHIFAAAVGLSAMIVASAHAFTIIKWAGALYLVYLGVTMLLPARAAAAASTTAAQGRVHSMREIFAQGCVSNILNPKVAMFFLAFLPQFVEPDAPSNIMAFLLLGLLLNVIGTAWNLAVALAAARMRETETASRAKLWLERGIGLFFLGIGARLALMDRP